VVLLRFGDDGDGDGPGIVVPPGVPFAQAWVRAAVIEAGA
jgi:hypothetical protein